MLRSVVLGCGAYLPEKILTNDDIAKFVDTDDTWVVERTGIRQRHVAAEGELTSDLALAASKVALERAGLDAQDIDLIVLFDAERHGGDGYDEARMALQRATRNMAKMLSAEASWAAGEACIQTHGGFGFAEEYDIERKYREARLYQVAPISTNLILSFIAEHVLGMPRSY